MKFLFKHYYILVFFLLFILLKCSFVIFWYKPYPNIQSDQQEMRLIGMPSYDKLITLKLLKNNSGINKHLSFSGQHIDQIIKQLGRVTSKIDCLEVLNNSDTIKLKYTSRLSQTNNKNITIQSIKLLQELDKLKLKVQIDLTGLLSRNFAQFESNAAEKGLRIEVCTLDESISQFLKNIKKDPEERLSRVEIRRCFINTDNCKLSFIREYWSSKYKIFYIYLRLNEKSRFDYNNRSIEIIKSKPIDYLTENKNFTDQFLDLLVKYSLFPVNFSNNANLKSEFNKITIISNLCILFWFWLIITAFSIFFFHTILLLIASCLLYFSTILFSYICYFYLFKYLRSNANAASLYNIISIVALYLIILNDSLIVSICYSQSRKQIASSRVRIAERSKRITINTLRQSFYYILPKNMAFLFILFVSYLNQIETIQKFCLFLIILIISYMILGFSLYSLAILFLSNYHHKFWYKHQIKIFDIDLNEMIKKIFSDQIPFLVTRFSFFWIIFFTCLTALSLFMVFYYPKFSFDEQFISLKTKTDLKISIIWGSMVQHYSQNVNSLMSIEMELHAFEQYDQIAKLCEHFKNFKQPQWIKKPNCFSLSLNEFFQKLPNRKNLEQIDILIDVETRLMDPIFKRHETKCNLKDLHITQNLFNECIKWWSLKVLQYEINQNKTFKSSPVFLPNRLVPSLYFIQIETNLEIERLEYEKAQLIVNSIESWWKNLVQQFKLNENFVWWTSEQLENYYFQKKANQQILLTSLVSLIIILAISIYSCSKLITSLCVYVTIVCSLLTTSAFLICLNFKINLYNINLFILQIILATQYSIFKGVSLRYSPHVDQQNCIIWSFSNVGLCILIYWLLSCLGSLPLVFSSVKFYSSLGKVIFLTNLVSYWYSILFLPSLLYLSSKDVFQDLLAKIKVNKRNNNRHRFPFGRQTSTSSFAPSIVYSHARTISTYLESDLTDVAEYRRRTLSRCSTGFNSHKNSITTWYPNGGRNSLSNQNPNYLQIPRVSRNSVRRISNQSRRSSMMHSRRHSNLITRRNSRKTFDSDDQSENEIKSSSSLSIPSVIFHNTSK